jgi:hypothetical protein
MHPCIAPVLCPLVEEGGFFLGVIMNWLNIEIKTLCSEEFLGSEPLDRATWLCLMRYCAQHENGGTIKDCEAWGDRKWMQLVGITTQEVCRDSELWNWDKKDLIVWAYPIEQQKAVEAKREAGKRFGKGKQTKSNKDSDSSANSLAKGNSKGIVKESKGKKSKYLDSVMLTEKEYDTLCSGWGDKSYTISERDRAIEILDNYIRSNGKKYASHYAVLQGWVYDKVKQETPQEEDYISEATLKNFEHSKATGLY